MSGHSPTIGRAGTAEAPVHSSSPIGWKRSWTIKLIQLGLFMKKDPENERFSANICCLLPSGQLTSPLARLPREQYSLVHKLFGRI